MLSPNSPQGKKARQIIDKVRTRRAVAFARSNYNRIRQNYYRHIVMMTTEEKYLVSIIVPCYNTPPRYFEPLLNSVFDQSYSNWELILVDASDKPDCEKYLSKKAEHDTRIRYIKVPNEGIAVNTNKGLEVAKGELIAFLDHDDVLDPNALSECAELFNHSRDLGLVYTDEDKISDDGSNYFQPHFKPDFSLDMLRNVNYINHLTVVKKSLADAVSGLRKGYDGAQDYDFLLRIVDRGAKIGHVPKVLYHWREAEGSTASNFKNKQHITQAGCKALMEHYQRRNIKTVEKVVAIEDRPGFYRPIYKKPTEKLKIYINFVNTRLLPIEREYIISRYRQQQDVKLYGIEVIEGKPSKQAAGQLVINGAYLPKNTKVDLLSLFMLGQEEGVNGVAPKIVRHGRIFDMGLVRTDAGYRLFLRNVDPNHYRSFGSLEWVRNVDALTEAVWVKNPHHKQSGRYVIWSHTEFDAFQDVIQEQPIKNSPPNYYNPNLSEAVEVFDDFDDFVVDRIKVKQ